MKNILIALGACLMATTAMATDLPKRTPAPAPVPVQREATNTGFYVGVNGGVAWKDTDTALGTIGGTVGYEFNRYIRAEVNALNRFGPDSGQFVTVDGVVGYPVGKFTPYALVGTGYGFNGYGNANKGSEPIWSVGGGVRYAVNYNWEVDTRYRYIATYNSSNRDNNVVTLGINYKF